MSPGSSTWRWAGAVIGGSALALGVFVLLGALISPRFAVVRHVVEVRIVAFYRRTVCDCSGLPMRGLVLTRNPDNSTSVVPGAVFCDPRFLSADGCAYPAGISGRDGSFDFEVDFDLVSFPRRERDEKATVLVSAPGCTPKELRVRRRGPYEVILDCPHRNNGLPAVPSSPVNALLPSSN
jgi:hypothetical protein